MFITFSQLVRELQRSLSIQSYNISDQQIISEIALLPTQYTPGDAPLRQDTVYICEFWQLKRFEPSISLAPLICVVEPNADPLPIFFANRPIAVVFGSSLVNTMLALSNVTYNLGCKSSIITEVSHSLLQCRGIDALMEEGFRALQNPIMVTDQDQKLLCYTDPDLVTSPIYRIFVSSGYLPVGHPNTSTLSPAWSRLDIPFLTQRDEDLFPVICKSLSIGDSNLGYLHVIQFHHSFDEQDLNIAELLGNLLTVELQRSRRSLPRDEQGRMQRFLRDILDNHLGSPEDGYEKQRQLGLNFKPCLYALAINIRRADPGTRILFSDLAGSVAALLPGCHSLFYRNSVFALIESDREIIDMEAFLAPLRPLLEKHPLICGVSNLFHSVFDLRSYGYQTTKALQLGSTLDPDRLIYLYQDYTVDYMMELCLRHEASEVLSPPSFLRLRQYCNDHGPTLLETLDVYLRRGRSKSETAKALFVHLNTVKYRIAQIQEIMGVSLDDDDTILDLMLAFRLARHRERFLPADSGSVSP